MQLAGLSVGRGEFVIVVKQQKTEKIKKSIISRRMRVRGWKEGYLAQFLTKKSMSLSKIG